MANNAPTEGNNAVAAYQGRLGLNNVNAAYNSMGETPTPKSIEATIIKITTNTTYSKNQKKNLLTQLLVRLCKLPNVANKDYDTIRSIIQQLVKAGADINSKNDPACVVAIQYGNYGIFYNLVREGADPTILFEGDTLYHVAVRTNNNDGPFDDHNIDRVLGSLDKYNNDFYSTGKRIDINALNKDGDTALHIAVNLGNANAIYYIIRNSYGANANQPNAKGETPLQVAINKFNKLAPNLMDRVQKGTIKPAEVEQLITTDSLKEIVCNLVVRTYDDTRKPIILSNIDLLDITRTPLRKSFLVRYCLKDPEILAFMRGTTPRSSNTMNHLSEDPSRVGNNISGVMPSIPSGIMPSVQLEAVKQPLPSTLYKIQLYASLEPAPCGTSTSASEPSNALPEGWEEYQTPNGRTAYTNGSETQWNRPKARPKSRRQRRNMRKRSTRRRR